MSLFHISQTGPALGAYSELVRTPHLSCGVYRLKAGEPDLQQPHTEDEIYYVAAGKAMMRIGDEELSVEPGAVIFVPAYASHRFHSIVEDLALLVAFGPAEGTGIRPEPPAEPWRAA